jgi:hypothetical protein
MLNEVRFEVQNEDVARPLMDILLGNERAMKRPATDVQNTAGLRKTVLCQGWDVYLRLADLEALVLL